MAQEAFIINDNSPLHDLNDKIWILKNSKPNLGVEEVLKLKDSSFVPYNSEETNLIPHMAYWAKVVLINNSNDELWNLELEDEHKSDIAWVRSNGKVDVFGVFKNRIDFHYKTGIDYPKNERTTKDHWILNRFELSIPKGESAILLIRVEGNSFGMPPYFNLSLRQMEYKDNHPLAPFEFTFHFFLLGVCFIIFIYHVLHYVYSREHIFLWFSIWALLCTFTLLFNTGLDGETLLANLPSWRFPLWFAIPNFTLFSFWFFGREFINSKTSYPKIDRYIIGLGILVLVFVSSHLILYFIFEKKPEYTQIGFNYEIPILLSLLGLILSIVLALKKDLFSRYFGIGAIVASLSVLLGSLWSLNIIKLPFDPYAWGLLFQVVIYSFGIAYRQQQKAKRSEQEKIKIEKQKAEILRIRDMDAIKSKFFANLSHEFRTPLSLILGPLQSLEKSTNKDKSIDGTFLDNDSLKIIKKNANRLNELIEQLLELAKLDDHKVPVNLKYGEIEDFMDSIIQNFNHQTKRKNLNFFIQRPHSETKALFDPDKLEKIIGNLLANAIKYTPPKGTISIIIGFDDQQMHFSIEDTGPGISKENIERIFERFYRVESNEDLGSGIGLALVKELVELLNGVITVRSELNKGTIFSVSIPTKLELLPRNSLVSKKKMTAGPNNVDKRVASTMEIDENNHIVNDKSFSNKSKILVVEDNEDLNDYIRSILKDQYIVLSAMDGLQGELMAIKNIPDVIITDIRMPKKTGYELCDSLKGNIKTSHIPIIMLTAKVTQDDKMQGLRYGANAYVTKPFNSKELLLRVHNLIKARERVWDYFKTLDGVHIKDISLPTMEDKFLQQVFSIIKSNIDNDDLRVEDIGKEVGFSRSQLHRKLKSLIDKSPHQLIIDFRLNKAKRLLETNSLTVSEVAYSVGYNSLAHFTKSFKEKFGVLPSKVYEDLGS